ncbi:MAG: RHS repeat domain-containing protein [Clostridiaceae bacterium]
MNLNGVEYYYVRNAQGDIIGLIDKNGNEVVTYSYDSWGKLISIDGTLKDTVGVKNPYRYRGYRYDSETGLYYLQSRYYNPEWGRFINADGIIGQTGNLLGHNMFSYCRNNPVNLSDPTGLFPKFPKILKNIVKAIIYVADKIASAFNEVWGTFSQVKSWFSWGVMKNKTSDDIKQTKINHTENVVNIGSNGGITDKSTNEKVKVNKIQNVNVNNDKYFKECIHDYELMQELNLIRENTDWEGLSSQEQDALTENFRMWDIQNTIIRYGTGKCAELAEEGMQTVAP